MSISIQLTENLMLGRLYKLLITRY